ncbi:hypothetical protein [Sphaerotilus sp.]|uniref:hypothetical protein n=1 Tax=Sphaerotilus sp. TaxID=2093942 RepID=UPI002ACD68D1|nr:hypothetical protein [Sphaerotilus sp.]MDZ7856441.1 hypothetical protein [Sphaerotilus sp.]
MNTLVIEHVPIADLPPAWRAQLSHTAMSHARVTVRIENETPAEVANDARTRLRGSLLRYDDPLEPCQG